MPPSAPKKEHYNMNNLTSKIDNCTQEMTLKTNKISTYELMPNEWHTDTTGFCFTIIILYNLAQVGQSVSEDNIINFAQSS